MNPLIMIGVAAAGLLALASSASAKKPTATPQKPGANLQPPPDVLAKITGAFNSADPAQLLAVAKEVEALGYKAQADDLRGMAAMIERAIKSGATVPPAPPPQPTSSPTQVATVAPAVTPADIKAPGVVTSPGWPSLAPPAPSSPSPVASSAQLLEAASKLPAVVAPDPLRVQAGAVALMLAHSRKGSEDRAQVRSYQAANPEAGKADGLYGPKTALTLAKKYAIIPPKPFYWPVNPTPAKTAYNAEIMKLAMLDPPRFDEWVAAKVK